MERRLAVCDYRSALRSATAPLHGQIDALFGTFDLSDRDGLTRFLVAQAIGMRACQPIISRFGRGRLGHDGPDWLAIIRQDLAMLSVAAERLPQFELAADIADPGVFYVVAGSRMGAAVLRKQATALTPAGPASASCGYFAADGGPVMWRLFREWLADQASTDEASEPAELAAMVHAAEATFQLFARAAEWAAAQPVLPAIASTGTATEGLAA
jgi:heme oxygenase